jgi:hypothetical protein
MWTGNTSLKGKGMDWKRGDATALERAIPATWLFPHYYEALNTLFRIENALRMLVYVVLKNDKRNKWIDICVTSDESGETTIGALAKKRIAQHQMFGYLGFPIESPMMHLTSGELVRLIISDAHWPLFKEYFRAARQVVTLKLQEIGDVRNALAHFRPLTQDDVEAVRQNAKQVLSAVESALGDMVQCSQRVPTNTTSPWYHELRAVGTSLCGLEFNQSSDGRWVRIVLRFAAKIISQSPPTPDMYVIYKLLGLDTPEILSVYDDLRRLTIYLTERIPWFPMPSDFTPIFVKRLEFTFSRSTLESDFSAVLDSFRRLVAEIDNEAELIVGDNLAKGRLIYLSQVVAIQQSNEKGHKWWQFNTSGLQRSVENHHPPEYWGAISIPATNLISDTDQFPWMSAAVSREEIPF